MKRQLTYSFAALLALASCTKEADVTPVSGNAPVFTATLEVPGTKTELDGTKVKWLAGDEIAILGNGTSATAAAAAAGEETTFPTVGTVGEAPYWAVYPSGAATYDGTFKVTVPAVQTGAFDAANIMVATTTDQTLAFKNLCGLLKFTVGDGVTAVSLKADNETDLAGTATVTFDAQGIPSVSAVEDAVQEITVTTGAAGTYYVALLPGITLGGFYFELTTADGTQTVFSPKDLTVTRSSVQNMGAIGDHVVVDWFVTPAGAGKRNGVSWENAFGLADVQALFPGGQISKENVSKYGNGTFHFQEGTYDTFASTIITLDFTQAGKMTGLSLLGGYARSSTGTSTATRDVAAYPTVFDGSSASLAHLFRLDRYADVVIDGFTFRSFTGTSSDVNSGGGPVCYSYTGASSGLPKFTFSHCTFSGNKSLATGGAILVRKGYLTIEDSTFSANEATTSGGAVHIVDAFSSVTVKGAATAFTGNSAGTNGGALYLAGASSLKIDNGSFSENHSGDADYYGGVIGIGSSGTLTVDGGVFNDNSGTKGGVIGCNSTSHVKINGGTFSGNTTTATGGVAWLNGTTDFVVTGGTFEKNTSPRGGVFYHGGAVVQTITGGQFLENTATGAYGGGVVAIGSTGTVNIEGGTFSGNIATAGEGGAVAHVQGKGTVNISGGTFNGGKAHNGGVLYLDGNYTSDTNAAHDPATVKITGGTFSGNEASTRGGFIFAQQAAHQITIEGTETSPVVISGNTALVTGQGAIRGGGALFINGANGYNASVVMSYARFENNQATAAGGGAIAFEGNYFSTIKLSHCTFAENKCGSRGGAIYSDGGATNYLIEYCTFEKNTATSGDGYGGAFNLQNTFKGTLKVNHTDFTDNVAKGGGAWSDYNNNMTHKVYFNACKFSGNNASTKYGNAIYHCSGNMAMNNCAVYGNILSGNTAYYAIYTGGNSNGSFLMANSTLNQNGSRGVYSIAKIKVNVLNSIIKTSGLYWDGAHHADNAAKNTVFGADSGSDFDGTRGTNCVRVAYADLTALNNTFVYSGVNPEGFTEITETASSDIAALDAAFDTWLQSVDGYTKDIDGNDRKAPYWPGCYQK